MSGQSVDPMSDLHKRWLPSPEQIAAAVALLATVKDLKRGYHYALVPLAQPGKEYGLWEIGQQVAHPDGVWLAENAKSDSEPVEHPFAKSREEALTAAALWMRERGLDGTVGYAVIDADGEAAVFEEILSVEQILTLGH